MYLYLLFIAYGCICDKNDVEVNDDVVCLKPVDLIQATLEVEEKELELEAELQEVAKTKHQLEQLLSDINFTVKLPYYKAWEYGVIYTDMKYAQNESKDTDKSKSKKDERKDAKGLSAMFGYSWLMYILGFSGDLVVQGNIGFENLHINSKPWKDMYLQGNILTRFFIYHSYIAIILQFFKVVYYPMGSDSIIDGLHLNFFRFGALIRLIDKYYLQILFSQEMDKRYLTEMTIIYKGEKTICTY